MLLPTRRPKPIVTAPEADLLVRVVQAPEEVGGGPGSALVLRVRANKQVARGQVYVSADTTSYRLAAENVPAATAGTLIEPMTAEQVEGPLLAEVGPDFDTLPQLSDADFEIGRLLARIDDEWLFVQGTTALGGDRWRPTVLIRGVFGTSAAIHDVGSTMFLIERRRLVVLRDPAVRPDVEISVKTLPATARSVASLAAMRAVSVRMPALPTLVPGYDEVPTGTYDGINVDFYLDFEPYPQKSLVLVTVSGEVLRQGDDYTLRGNHIVATSPPADPYRAFYSIAPKL